MPQTGSFTAVAELEMSSFMRSRDSGRGILAIASLDYGPSCFDSACPNRETGDCCIFKDE
jgi:hypothetical protein